MRPTKKKLEKLFGLRIATPGWFAKHVANGRWKYPEHIKLIDKHLVWLTQRKIKQLIINMPPRHGKSEFISKYFPAWYLGTHPEHRVILVSYEASFAASWGRKVRNLLDQHGEFNFGIKLNPAVRSAKNFEVIPVFRGINAGGSMDTMGAGGPITGKGADLVILDDPVKNDSEAMSVVMRENIWNWFNATLLTRLEPEGVIVIIMTRWHEDDLCGRIIRNDLDTKWNVLSLPAIADEEDLLGRKPGEALWPCRYSIDNLNEKKKNMGSYIFSALYQQKPMPNEGGVFKRKNFRYFSVRDGIFCLNPSKDDERKTFRAEDCGIFATMDLAVTDKQTSDYTVAIIFYITPESDVLILEVLRVRMEGAKHVKFVEDIYSRWKTEIIGIESTSYQLKLVQELRNTGYNIQSLKADRNKVSRALPIAAKMESGKVYFRENAPWLMDFEDEILCFPKGRHDDQVDAFAYTAYMIQPKTDSMPAGAEIKRIPESGLASKF